MTPYADRPARREWVALALILLLAAALRMGAPGVSEFKLDEARLSALALDMARGQHFPLLGIGSSVGIPNLPVSVWLFALPYALSPDPTIATLYVGLLNVLAVALTWALTRRYFGPQAALVAALMYAASPWGVIYSRKIWAQNMLPPFVVLTVGTGLIGLLEEDRPRRGAWQVAHLALLAITVQIHYAAIVLIPLTLAMLWMGRRHIARRGWIALALIAGLAVAALGLALWRLQATGFDFSVFGRQGLGLTTEALYHFSLVLSGNEIHSLAGPQQFEHYLAGVPDITLPQQLFGWAVIFSTAWVAYRALRGRSGPGRHIRLSLIGWLLLPPATFSLTWTPTYPHYMIPALPAIYILFGAGAVAAWQALARRLPRAQARGAALLMGTGLLLLAGLQAWNTASLYAFLDRTWTPGAFGTPLHYLLEVREAILETEPDDVLVAGISDDPRTDQDAAVWSFLLYDVPSVRPLDGTRTAVIASHTADQILLNTLALLAMPEAEVLPESRCNNDGQRFPLRPGEGVYIICAQRTPEPGQRQEPVAVFANSLRLVSVTPPRPDEPVISLGWAADGPLEGDYTIFQHLLDGRGERIGQQDSALWPGRYWRGGEVVLHHTRLPADLDLAAAATLRIGLYQLIDGIPRNVDILDAAGNPTGQWVDIPLGGSQPLN